MVNVRRLAAVDLFGLGPKIIIPELAIAVLGAPALGVLTLFRSTSLTGAAFGIALIGVGANYVPMLVHAIDLVRHTAVQAAIVDEASDGMPCTQNTESSRCGFSFRSSSASQVGAGATTVG